MNPTKSILLAGSTGYLGKHLLNQLLSGHYKVRAIARKKNKLKDYHQDNLQIIEAELTEPKSLEGVCAGIHTIISTVGITRQKDGLTYMDVDYKANLNLLEEAKRAGVEHFVYVSAINGDKYRHLKIFEAKEKFVDALVSSGLNYTIVRPNGFFSDMKDFLEMARSGNIFLFGNGEQKFNPIAGEDLAEAMVQQLENPVPAFSIGGPDVLSLNEVSSLALKACGKKGRIIHLPDWLRKFSIWSLRTFTGVKTYGPVEFFLTLMAEDNVAPTYGKYHLKDFFEKEGGK